MAGTKSLFNQMNSSGGFSNATLCYPDNLGQDEFAHAIFISIYERNGNSSDGRSSRNVSGGQAKAFRTDNPTYAHKQSLIGTTSQLSQTIALYMPDELTTEYSISYSNTDVTQSINYARAANWAKSSMRDLYKNSVVDAIGQNLENTVAEKGGAKNAASSAMSGMMDFGKASMYNADTVSTALSLYTQVAKNPHMEYVFDKVDNRTYNFKFVFTPKNATETQNIDNIIRLLKRTAIPKVNEMSGSLGVYYDYPCVYDIAFQSGGSENQWLPKISTCLLTSIKTDPTTESGFRVFQNNNAPVKITLDLSFEEMETMSQQRIDQGY